jgi:hypothetical protein
VAPETRTQSATLGMTSLNEGEAALPAGADHHPGRRPRLNVNGNRKLIVSLDPPVSRRVVRDWCRRQRRDPKTDRPS